MLSKSFNRIMNNVTRRHFAVMPQEVKNHLLKLGITNKNIVYNPRYVKYIPKI
jgi:hypothetical protein